TLVATVPPLNDAQQKAFVQLDYALRGPEGATGNIRDAYDGSDFITLAYWRGRMYSPDPPPYDTPVASRPNPSLPKPDDIDPAAWNAVTWQIYWEMIWVEHVQDWFGVKMKGLINDQTTGKQAVLNTLGTLLNIPPKDSTNLTLNILALIAAALALAFAAA